MKKLAVTLTLFLIVMGSVGLFAQDRLTVDLKTLPLTRNAEAFKARWDDLMIVFPAWPATINWPNFNRVVVKIKYFDANNREIRQQDGQAILSLVEDPNGDIRGPGTEGPSPNIPYKTYNVGGGSSSISRDTGAMVRFTKAPGAILIQNADANVKFIEVQEITFFRR
jgi:hypothetical protein